MITNDQKVYITKTCLYNVDPLKPHFYRVKLGFTGVYTIVLISAKKHRLWVLVRTARPSPQNLCFEQKYKTISEFLSENFLFFLVVKFSVYLNRRFFRVEAILYLSLGKWFTVDTRHKHQLF